MFRAISESKYLSSWKRSVDFISTCVCVIAMQNDKLIRLNKCRFVRPHATYTIHIFGVFDSSSDNNYTVQSSSRPCECVFVCRHVNRLNSTSHIKGTYRYVFVSMLGCLCAPDGSRYYQYDNAYIIEGLSVCVPNYYQPSISIGSWRQFWTE